jgi:D-serine deaminase-like pyridoxal phosphate-dependent protein
MVSLSQEHGVLRSDRALDPSWQPGSRVRILPNHSCLAAACFDRFHVLRGREIVNVWHPIRGW